MKHFFIINPVAHKIKGKLNAVTESIQAFFAEHPNIDYDIHVTRWERDALGVIRRFAMNAGELLRIHVMGGAGTSFEAVNGVIGLPNAQLALYPFGRENPFLRYFGDDKLHLFSSIRSQVFSDTVPIDALRCGHNYGLCHGLIGLEASANKMGLDIIERGTIFPEDFAYIWAAAKIVFRGKTLAQNYRIELDDEVLEDKYITMMVGNVPCYGNIMNPAVDAHPNDGILDIYLVKNVFRGNFPSVAHKYLSGNYQKLPGIVSHYRSTKISVASESTMCVCVDGQIFYKDTIEYEVMPYAIDFVCPGGIDIDKLPHIYGRPETAVKEGLS